MQAHKTYHRNVQVQVKFCFNSPRFDAQRIAQENEGSFGNIWELLVMTLTASPAETVI